MKKILTAGFCMVAALSTVRPAAAMAEGELRGSAASMTRQHFIAVDEELTFARTPKAVLAEVEAGTLTPLTGNEDYTIANVSFAYAVPEVRMLVERLAQQYRRACGERLVVTSLTRPRIRQPRNAHKLSVHPAGMAVDLRISRNASCRTWLESTLISLEGEAVLDVTRERRPPHYHVAVFPTPYREYVQRIDAIKAQAAVIAQAKEQQRRVAPAAAATRPSRASVPSMLVALSGGAWLIAALALLKKKRVPSAG